MRLHAIAIAAAIAAAYAPVPAGAQDSQGRNLAASCAICHGTEGRQASGDLAPLAGMPKDYIVRQLRDFRDGKRPATVMHQIAKGYTEPQMEALASWFAAQKR
jgi:sulfide dehydrogenase cytochrome subunit